MKTSDPSAEPAGALRYRALITGSLSHSKHGVVFLTPDADAESGDRKRQKRRRRSQPHRAVLLPPR